MHLVGEEDGQLALAIPLYLKSHSYGEYVFDWQWANAFERYGRNYFPKALTAIPFTPASGPRILTQKPLTQDLLSEIEATIETFAKAHSLSSWHILFPEPTLAKLMNDNSKLLRREDVQFHWQNRNYNDFDDFLTPFRSSKRKQIRRERRIVASQGIELSQKTGAEIQLQDWEAFYDCYQATYLKRSGHSGYLNWEFFQEIARSMSDQVMIVLAHVDETVIASSLFFFDENALYGRYWGALGDYDCLHFEACYYQGIDFAIKKKLSYFNPGTQGEHKLVRGFEPVKTCSFHWIADAEFADAIKRYLEQEREQITRYQTGAAESLPFHRDEI